MHPHTTKRVIEINYKKYHFTIITEYYYYQTPNSGRSPANLFSFQDMEENDSQYAFSGD